MKRILLFTMMCLFGLFSSLNAQETSFSYDFEDGSLTGWRVYQGSYANADNWQVADTKGEGGSKGIYSVSVTVQGYASTEYIPKNYVVTTNAYQITATSSLSWYMVFTDEYGYPSWDSYQVIASEDGSNFNTVIWTGNGNNSGLNTISLAEYAGKTLYLGFYHYVPQGYGDGAIALDNIALTVGEDGGETPDDGGDDEGDDETNNVVTIGSGSSTNNTMPTRPASAYSATQQIYTASEINHAAGAITKIALKGENPYGYTRNWEVYMANTDKTAFSSKNDWVTSNLEKVFDGQVAVPSNADWFELEFTNNFNYEGNGISLCVIDKTGSSGSGMNFYTFDGSSLSVRGSSPYDVNSLPTAGYQNTFKNQIQLTFAAAGEGGTTPEPTAPEAPEVTAEATGYNTATFTWEAVEGATSYKVYSGTYEIAEVTDPVYYASNLSYYAGTEVCFTFTAVNEHGESEATQACVLVYPAAPKNLAATANETTITLTWDAVTGAESYNVYSGTETVTTGLTEATFTTEELAAGEYCYTVTAVNASGESAASTEACATIEEPQQGGDDEPTVDIVTIGEGNYSKAYYAPISNYGDNAKYSYSQQIYLKEEIGKDNGTIVSIDFHNVNGGPNERNIIVYMSNVEKSSYSSSEEYIDVTDADIVYQGYHTFGNAEEWTTIELQTPFVYTGKNIAITVNDLTGIAKGYSGYDQFYSTITTENRGLYGLSTSAFDCSNLGEKFLYILKTGAYSAPANTPYVADLRLTFGSGNSGGDGQEPSEFTYRLVEIYQDEYNNEAYTYESETSDVVTEIIDGYYKTLLEYNEDGQIAKTTYAWVDPSTGEMDLSSYDLVTYTYEDGVLVSYKKEKVNSYNPSSSEYVFSYNAEGQVETITTDSQKTTFTYTNGLVTEKLVVRVSEGVETPTEKEVYEYEDGKLAAKYNYWYNPWGDPAGFELNGIYEYEYDANGNCVAEHQFREYEEDNEIVKEPAQSLEYYYDLTISNADVYTFAYPESALLNPVVLTRNNVVTKTLSYRWSEDYLNNPGVLYKDDFTVTTYTYDPEILAAPFAPMDLTAEVLSDKEVQLTWNSLEEGMTFTVYNGTEVVAEGVTELTYKVSGLTASKDYCFTVVGVNGTIVSAPSNEVCVTTMDLVNVEPKEIAFGEVRLGDYWSEVDPVINVRINPLGKEITAIESDNTFFRIPATINLTDEIVEVKVNCNYKSAEAGEYTGNLNITLSTGDVVAIPMTATAYTPVTPDIFELATEVEFTEAAYEDTPDFATLYDDYNLPNEEGENLDAVYVFELEEDAVVTASAGENGIYAIYKEDFGGEDAGPTAENAYYGDEIITNTAFSYSFESADLSDFTIVDNDEFKDYTWAVEDGALKSYSFISIPDYPYYIVNVAKERIITNEAYAITANTVLTFDLHTNDYGGNAEHVIVEVTQDGQEFTEIAYEYNENNESVFVSKRIDLGAKFAELGLEYGDYQISLLHNTGGYAAVSIDNFALTERCSVYPAGKYYLVAAAAETFTVNLSYEVFEGVPDIPVAKAYRLESLENFAPTYYTYDEVYTNRVVSYEQDGITSKLTYNQEGQLVSILDTFLGEDEDGNPEEMVVNAVTYTYNEDGTLATHTEEQEGWIAMETVYTYEDGKLVKSVMEAYGEEVTYAYNAEGLVSEKVIAYEGEVDSKDTFVYDAEGRVVDYGVHFYDYEAEDLTLAEGYEYVYDANGNCTAAKSYFIENDEKVYFQTVEYYYDETISNEDVYIFELPQVALTSVAPAHANILVKELSYYTEYDDNGEAHDHSYVLAVYNYSPTVELAPIAPAGLIAELEENTVTLTWEAFDDAETFTVYQGGTVVAENVEEGTYEITGLADGKYCYTVVAVNAIGESKPSNEACVTVGDVLAAPENLEATAVSATSISLTWDAVEGATSYNVYSADVVIAEGLTETTYVVEELEAEQDYCYTVTAVNEDGESEKSNEACAKTLPGDGVAENEMVFNVYPNPADNVVFVETASKIEAVSVYTVTGVMIYSEEGAMNNVQINVSDFSAGVYVVKVRTDNGEVVKHFVKK